MTIRATTLTILTVLLFLTPTAALVKFQSLDDPELGRIKALYYTNPENEEYRRQHDEYMLNRDSLYFQKTPNQEE